MGCRTKRRARNRSRGRRGADGPLARPFLGQRSGPLPGEPNPSRQRPLRRGPVDTKRIARRHPTVRPLPSTATPGRGALSRPWPRAAATASRRLFRAALRDRLPSADGEPLVDDGSGGVDGRSRRYGRKLRSEHRLWRSPACPRGFARLPHPPPPSLSCARVRATCSLDRLPTTGKRDPSEARSRPAPILLRAAPRAPPTRRL